MSLATRCPACGTIFRVVQDQLKVSEGWVRCGQCHEVFHGIEALFDLDSDPALAARRAARSGTPPSAAFAGARPSPAPTPTSTPSLANDSEQPPVPVPASVTAPTNPEPPPAPVAPPLQQPPSPPRFASAAADPADAPGASAKAGFTPAAPASPAVPTPPATPVAPVIRGTMAPRFAARLAEERAQASARPSAFLDSVPAPTAAPSTTFFSPPAPAPATLDVPAPAAVPTRVEMPVDAPAPAVPPAPTPPTIEPSTRVDVDLSAAHATPDTPAPPRREWEPAPPPAWTPASAADAPSPVVAPPPAPAVYTPAPAPAPALAVAPVAPQEAQAPVADAGESQLVSLSGGFGPSVVADPTPSQLADNLVALPPPRQPRTISVKEAGPPAVPAAPAARSRLREDDSVMPIVAARDIGGSTLPSRLAEEDDRDDEGGPPTLASMLPDVDEWPPRPSARKRGRARPTQRQAPSAESIRPDDPRFLREARREARWGRPWVRAALGVALVALVVGAGAQLAWPQRDTIASRWPVTRPALDAACHLAGCVIEPPRALASLALDGSSLTRTGTEHVLLFSADLHNRSDHEVRMPSFDLTFMDLNGEVVARKVLSPAQIGIRATALAPEAELHVHARIQVGTLDASGFQAEMFYP